MFNPGYLPFSMMGEKEKANIERVIDRALGSLEEIHAAPHAAKENLAKIDFKTAVTELNFVGRLIQAESAMAQALTVMADRAGKSEDFRAIIGANLPQIQLPAKKAKALSAR